ncbi:MAG: 5-(carboxyamino)imidazole ribonucleotide mutase [Phycisphaerae bacterium]|nr:5-(carboxyamino)imidazole ribonucleotide mutase [Phycisphaerae bacterium]
MQGNGNLRVGVVMGSISDYETMEHAAKTLEQMGIEHEVKVLSAHRTPEALCEWIDSAHDRGVEVFIAAAGGAAHLAGVVASKTILPVLGVPIESKSLKGLDSLLSIVQMPAGIPVGTLAIGKAGAINAALFAAAILGIHDENVAGRINKLRADKAQAVLESQIPVTT